MLGVVESGVLYVEFVLELPFLLNYSIDVADIPLDHLRELRVLVLQLLNNACEVVDLAGHALHLPKTLNLGLSS